MKVTIWICAAIIVLMTSALYLDEAQAKGKHHHKRSHHAKKHHAKKHHAKKHKPDPTPGYYHGAGGEGYVAFGDSITRGLGSTTPYPGYLTAAREIDGGESLSLYNYGADGYQAPHVIALLGNPSVQALNGDARYITVAVGFNDIAIPWMTGYCGGVDNQDCYREAVVKFKANWDQILQKVSSQCKPGKTNIAVATIYANAPELNDTHKKYLEEINDHIKSTAAGRNIPVADLHTLFNGASHNQPPSAGWMADPTHPNDFGALKISEAFRSLPTAANC